MPYQALAGYQSMMSTILNGRRLVIIERFHPVLVMRLIQEHHINSVAVTPTMGRLMLDVPDFESYDVSSMLTFAYGAALTPPNWPRRPAASSTAQWSSALAPPRPAAPPPSKSCMRPAASMFDSVGQPVDGVEVKIVDEQGRDRR